MSREQSKRTVAVAVENVKRIDRGNLRALCTVAIGGLKIHSVRVVQEPGKKAWVSLPQQEWTDREGKKCYSAIIDVPDQIKVAIQHAVLESWRAESK